MRTIICFGISFLFLIFAVLKGISLGFALLACWLIFAGLARSKKYKLRQILFMTYEGAKKSFEILTIFLLIGAIISVWITSGTLPAIMYYCLTLVDPRFFVVFSFLACVLISFLIGTSFGTAATIGVALITLGRAGGISPSLMAGAIISGAYFGDRASPMSSTVAVVASLTGTQVIEDVKQFQKSAFIPLLLSLLFFGGFSLGNPLEIADNPLPEKIAEAFTIDMRMLFPAVLMFLLPILKVNVKWSMLASILCAFAASCLLQQMPASETLWNMWRGYTGQGTVMEGILESGGILSMLITYVIVVISCGLAGLFEGLHAFDSVKEAITRRNRSARTRFGMAAVTGLVTAAFGCTQTISIILSRGILSDCYNEKENVRLATDIANTGVLLAGLVPWNLACLVPTSTLGVDHFSFIPFAFYMYCIPLFTLLFYHAPNYRSSADCD